MIKNKQSSLPKKELESVFALYSSGKFLKAVDSIKELNNKYPNQPLLFNLIGACYKELEELAGAARMFEIAVTLSPNYAEAHFNLGVIYQDLNQKESAVGSYKKAIEIKPNYPSAHNNLGNLYRELGEIKSSIESLEWAIAYKHDFAEAHNNLGSALSESGRTSDAIKSFEKALSFDSNYARAIFNLALALKDIGNKDSYKSMIEKTVQLKPSWSDAQLHLSRVKKYKNNDPQVSEIHSFLSDNDLSLKDRINFNFTLAKVYEDIEDHEKQFKFLNEANRLRKEESEYFFEKDQKLFSRIKKTFNNPPKPLDGLILNTSKIKPIFILGMPRSGTSLVHQIISNHNQVYGAGELTKLNKFVAPFLMELNKKNKSIISDKDLISIRENYLESLSSLNASETIIVDKMPLNFRHIGFILTAFPEAKIIHMNRDPMAICWSIYKYYFPGNAYSYNQEDIAAYYGLYSNLMIFWKKLFPNKIYDLCYEDLTVNQEIETKKLLKYCDLDWDENCISFHKNNTAVKTTSSIQVKEKMYQGSSEAWKKYEEFLQPLIKGLNYY
jgi:Tfp pilus assembly protein PilF